MKTIVLTGGGTAGHCLPNIALLPYLKRHFDNIVYIGGDGIEKSIAKEHNLTYYQIPTVKLQRKFTFKNLGVPFKLFKSISTAKSILKDISPSIIFSKGGYVALPVVLAGSALSIPCVTHESDLTIGLSNKIMAKKCKYVL
jgi:UDP-N-acetylglucosamine--N-acetylmuramyl-(pentapeptide) pyrophosphoryl-undecaprenol N-acetylglucosamine transferase